MDFNCMALQKHVLSVIRNKGIKDVRLMFKDPCLRQSLDTFGATLLRYSAKHGKANVVWYLLDEGCDEYINAQDLQGRTALMLAVEGRHEDVIECLLNQGADAMVLNHENKNALQMICSEHDLKPSLVLTFLQQFRYRCSSNEEAAKKLVDAGCQLYQAVYTKDVKVVEYMLERGFSVDSAHPLTKSTALHVAVWLDSVESVTVLLKYNADVNALDSKGNSPLHYVNLCADGAANSRRSAEKVEILQLLLGQGVSPMTRRDNGVFETIFTLMYGDAETIRVLLSSWDFTAKAEEGDEDLLHCLAANDNPGVIDELKVHLHKCDVNALSKDGRSPLHEAASNGNVEMVQFLLEHGAEVNCAEHLGGPTPLHDAYAGSVSRTKKQHRRCIELLLNHGADPQFIVDEESGEQVTVFDAALKGECDRYEMLEPVNAQLALLEELGTPITELTSQKINADCRLKKQYDGCRRALSQNISGTVTLSKLLTGRERQLAKYAGNKHLLLKLKRIGDKKKIRASFSFYHGALVKRVSKGIELRSSMYRAAGSVSRIFQNRIDRTHVVVGRVSDYLSDQDLRQLCHL